jgi:hypothetical protein
MRTNAGIHTAQSESENCAHFFDSDAYRGHIPRKQASHGPRQAYDPLCVIVWLIAVPFFAGCFWYTLIGLIHQLWVSM